MKEGQAISMPVCSKFINRSEPIPFYTNIKHLNPVVLLERLSFFSSGVDTKVMVAKTCYETTDVRSSSSRGIGQPEQNSRNMKNMIEVKAWETINSSYNPPSLNVHDFLKFNVTFPSENSAKTEIAKSEGRMLAREQLLKLTRTEDKLCLTKDYFDAVRNDAKDPLFVTTNKPENSPKHLTSGYRKYLQLDTNLKKESTENKADNMFPESRFPQDNMNLQEIYTQHASFSINKSESVSKDENLKSHLKIHTHEEGEREISQLLKHMKNHNIKESYACETCTRKFTRKSNLIYHLESHIRSYKCQECQKKFSRKGYLRSHMATHTDVKGFECQTCKQKFKMKDHLRMHLKIHVDGEFYGCQKCSMFFTQKSQLAKHVKTHTFQQRRFQCKDCGKKFVTKSNFEKHNRIHSGVMPFVCHYCPKKFSDGSALRIHTIIHTGQKAFKCNDCARAFASKLTLLYHTTIHTGEKRFKCEECKRKFSLKQSLVKHISTHRDEKSFECYECNRKFSRKPHLENHIRIHTGERPFTCDICKKMFRTKCNWKFHTQIHAGDNCYECEECGKRFPLKYYLASHIKVHSSKKSDK